MTVVEHHESEAREALTDEARTLLEAPERRVEGHLKVTGEARYAADFRLPDMLWARFLTSPHAHARIVRIDTAAAKALPGVHAVLTGADVKPARLGRRLLDWPVLAWDRVRFIGDRVAVVAAETREIADEALSLIEVEYEELPAVLDLADALSDGAPILHPEDEAAEYIHLGSKRPPRPHSNLQGYKVVTKGDVDVEQAFARAARVFEHTFYHPRQHQGHIEPHASVLWLDGDLVRVVSTNKAPFNLRQQMSAALGIPAKNIVVNSRFIGGDFGGKGLSIDEFALYFLARATGRPVKSQMTYVDELQGVNPRHSASIRLKTGVDAEGRFVAHLAEVTFDGGAYGSGKAAPGSIPPGGYATLPTYHVPVARYVMRTVYTNTVPGGHMRAPGEVQALFAGESHVDMMARELGMDPLQFRLLNALEQGQTGPANERYREVRGKDLLQLLARETRWGETPLPPNVGRGIALGVRHVGGGKTEMDVNLREDGVVEVLTAVPDQGSGGHTVIQRVVAATLSVPLSCVQIRFGDTSEAPTDPGAGGSRVTHVAGEAARRGAVEMRERLVDLASEVMGWPAGEVHIENGRFVVRSTGESAPFQEVAQRIARGGTLSVRGEYDGEHHGEDEPGDFNFAAFMAEVEVDPDTGQVKVRDVVLAADVGTIINPVAHQGQMDGGFVYGLGGAMMEELPIEDGKVTTLSLGEYKLPTQMDLPRFRTVYLPTEVGPGPWGAKMAGEVSNSGVAPAIANAIADAVGARLTRLPLTAERVLAALSQRDN